MKKILAFALSAALMLGVASGCSSGSSSDSQNEGGSGGKETVYLLNWGEYLDPDILAKFNSEHDNIEVKERRVTSNEEMYTICSTEGSEIDIVVPSEYMVEQMKEENLLAKLDYSSMSNFEYIKSASDTRTFDPDSEYSVPYMIGTLGIVYNTTMVDDTVDSWDILWNEKYKGKIMMYNSIRDSLAVALIRLGYDINTTDQSQVEEAGKLLMEQRDAGIVMAYGTDDIMTSRISGTCALAVDYSGAAAAAISENSDLNYVVPKEGSNVWVDNLCVLESSKHKDAAMEFINYLCEPEVAAANSKYIGYTTPNEKAKELMAEDEEMAAMLENPAYIMKNEYYDRCEYYKYLGDSLKIYNDVWTKVLTS